MRFSEIPQSFLDTEEPRKPLIIADIGCGSGILGVGAILLGAGKVYAVDNDGV